MTGQVARKELLDEYLQKKPDAAYFESKLVRAEELTRQITECMDTRTANPAFDAYCRQDFLDNVLRGGMPIHLGEKEIFYVYARKHGDMERDYNYFRLCRSSILREMVISATSIRTDGVMLPFPTGGR